LLVVPPVGRGRRAPAFTPCRTTHTPHTHLLHATRGTPPHPHPPPPHTAPPPTHPTRWWTVAHPPLPLTYGTGWLAQLPRAPLRWPLWFYHTTGLRRPPPAFGRFGILHNAGSKTVRCNRAYATASPTAPPRAHTRTTPPPHYSSPPHDTARASKTDALANLVPARHSPPARRRTAAAPMPHTLFWRT